MDAQHAGSAARADRVLIERAARRLRDKAIRDGYAGLPDKHRAFALALVLDQLARHVRDLPAPGRVQVRGACRILVDGGPTDGAPRSAGAGSR